MWIITQDKTQLIDTNKIDYIGIVRKEGAAGQIIISDNKTPWSDQYIRKVLILKNIIAKQGDKTFILGTYSERASQVYNKNTDPYISNNCIKSTNTENVMQDLISNMIAAAHKRNCTINGIKPDLTDIDLILTVPKKAEEIEVEKDIYQMPEDLELIKCQEEIK